jgi:hypothetical protein
MNRVRVLQDRTQATPSLARQLQKTTLVTQVGNVRTKPVKIGFYATVLAIVSSVSVASAIGQSSEFGQGTIVNVQKQNVATPAVRPGANPTDTPLQSHYYRYQVSVQVNCEIYVGRYESELDDLPSELSPNNSVPIRLKKHAMYLDFPGDTLRMRIIHHEVSNGGACGQAAIGK